MAKKKPKKHCKKDAFHVWKFEGPLVWGQVEKWLFCTMCGKMKQLKTFIN